MTDAPEFQPGVQYALPAQAYHALPAARSSALKVLLDASPAHLLQEMREPQQPSDAMLFGTALHLAVLEPHLFEREVVVRPTFDRRTKSGREAAAAWDKAFPGVLGFDPETHAAVLRTRDAVLAHPAVRLLLDEGDAEVTLQWVDEETGVPCKARPDFLPAGGGTVDLKSAASASATGASNAVARHLYHVQAAHYAAGLRAAMGREPRPFVLVFAEREPPHGVACYALPDEALERGEVLRRRALRTLARCMETGEWPAYSPLIQTLQLPGWAFKNDHEVIE